MSKIAILYVCTGKYDVFWEGFFESAERNFFPELEKEYFVFSDSERMNRLQDAKVHVYYQTKSGWPYDTLLRYNWFCTIQDVLSEYDYCFFCNANTRFLKKVTETLVPLPTQGKPLVLAIHTRSYDDHLGVSFQPERNPESEACIPEGTLCRAYAGGFWGGTGEAVVQMCCTLRDRVARDLKKGIIAIWHDQSHLIKYATEVPHIQIGKAIVSVEENADPEETAIVFLNKDTFGGNDKLRDVGWKERLKHVPRKTYTVMLKIAKCVRLDGLLRSIVKGRKGKA